MSYMYTSSDYSPQQQGLQHAEVQPCHQHAAHSLVRLLLVLRWTLLPSPQAPRLRPQVLLKCSTPVSASEQPHVSLKQHYHCCSSAYVATTTFGTKTFCEHMSEVRLLLVRFSASQQVSYAMLANRHEILQHLALQTLCQHMYGLSH
jgi:hypothetical protein